MRCPVLGTGFETLGPEEKKLREDISVLCKDIRPACHPSLHMLKLASLRMLFAALHAHVYINEITCMLLFYIAEHAKQAAPTAPGRAGCVAETQWSRSAGHEREITAPLARDQDRSADMQLCQWMY